MILQHCSEAGFVLIVFGLTDDRAIQLVRLDSEGFTFRFAVRRRCAGGLLAFPCFVLWRQFELRHDGIARIH